MVMRGWARQRDRLTRPKWGLRGSAPESERLGDHSTACRVLTERRRDLDP